MGKRGTSGSPRKAARGAASSREAKKTPHRNGRAKSNGRPTVKPVKGRPVTRDAKRVEPPLEVVLPAVTPIDDGSPPQVQQEIPLPDVIVVPPADTEPEPEVEADVEPQAEVEPQYEPEPEPFVEAERFPEPEPATIDESPLPEPEPVFQQVPQAEPVPQEPPVQAGGPNMADHARDEGPGEPLLFEVGWEVC